MPRYTKYPLVGIPKGPKIDLDQERLDELERSCQSINFGVTVVNACCECIISAWEAAIVLQYPNFIGRDTSDSVIKT